MPLPHLPDGSPLTLPETELLRIRLCFTKPARFHFLHGGVIHGVLARCLGHDLPRGLVPFAPESGKISFEPGDDYIFGLTALGDARDSLAELESKLHKLGQGQIGESQIGKRRAGDGRSRAKQNRRRTLDGNFRLEEVERLPGPVPERLIEQARDLSNRRSVEMRFLSPLRLERPDVLRQRGRSFVDAKCCPPELLLERLWQRWRFLLTGAYPSWEERPELPQGLGADARHLTWLDLPVPGRPGKAGRPKGMTLGGVVGEVQLEGLTPDWCLLLAAMQAYHVGKSTLYGCGRYRLPEVSSLEEEPFLPAGHHLERCVRPEMFEKARVHVCSQSDAAGADHQKPDSLEGEDLVALGEALLRGRYRASDLLGFLMPKKDGGWRPLAMPTALDRVAQRAAIETLAPTLDSLLTESSFAYRKGFSRQGAARAIRQAYEDGYRYALDADIESFFDTVDWTQLFARLAALFPFEPLVGIIRQWVRAPVRFRGELIERRRGLPQGSPIAPLLANLFLDEFDDQILGEDFRLVRFADDFVILCRDPEEARRARDVARHALAELGLELNEEKTGLRSLDDGFHYLGYLFCRSMVLERSGHSKREAPFERPAEEPVEEPSAPTGWLSALPLRSIRRLEAGSRQRPTLQPIRSEADRQSESRRPLYLSDPEAKVHLEHQSLILGSASGDRRLPLRSVLHVVSLGRTRLTVPAMLALNRQQIPVYFCQPSGELMSRADGGETDWRLWQAQEKLLDEPNAALHFARAVIAAKLRNAATIAVRLGFVDAKKLARRLRSAAADAEERANLSELLGFEGRGARSYFESFGRSLPEGWDFSKRQRRPPPDAVNSLLSLGYSLLHHHATTALIEAGLNPKLGLLHRPSGRHDALASDLQEELRHQVDALVWSLIRRRQLKPDAFESAPGGRGVWLKREGRRIFVDAFENRLLSEFTSPGSDEPVTYREFLFRQAVQLRQYVLGRIDQYHPLVLKA